MTRSLLKQLELNIHNHLLNLFQNFSSMGQVSLVNGQLVRTPVLPAGFLQNVMHLPTGELDNIHLVHIYLGSIGLSSA